MPLRHCSSKCLYIIIPLIYFGFVCIVCIVVKLLDITALLELETQAFRYTHNNNVYVTNKIRHDLIGNCLFHCGFYDIMDYILQCNMWPSHAYRPLSRNWLIWSHSTTSILSPFSHHCLSSFSLPLRVKVVLASVAFASVALAAVFVWADIYLSSPASPALLYTVCNRVSFSWVKWLAVFV